MALLTSELERHRVQICKIAKDAGLDFFETIFELITYDQMNQIAAYGGFPVRYPHWRFGMEYERLAKGYEYGLSKIYEMVINTDPCYAYLMEGNTIMDQKLVMAHVYAHCDFFKNNQWFEKTNRKMMDQMANHATRIRRYIDRYGVETVEAFVDQCLSLENLIDIYSPYFGEPKPEQERKPEDQAKDFLLPYQRDYMRDYINPPEFIKEQKQKMQEMMKKRQKFPSQPERDILKFLVHYAPLAPWQQDILSLVREEAYYYAPQGLTKTMNEGWASYWHTKLMTEKILNDSEVIDYADHHSGTVAMSPNSYNPYKVGIELMRNIEERWNKGQFGKDWQECDSYQERKRWDKKLGLGRQKIFEVRKIYNDVTFIDEFLTEDFCIENKFFVYQYNKRTNRFEIDTRNYKAVKAQLLFHMTNFGQPIIRVEDGNFENRGELLLGHTHEGVDLQPNYLTETLKNVQAVWTRPVSLITFMDGEGMLFRYDGQEFKSVKLADLGPESREQS